MDGPSSRETLLPGNAWAFRRRAASTKRAWYPTYDKDDAPGTARGGRSAEPAETDEEGSAREAEDQAIADAMERRQMLHELGALMAMARASYDKEKFGYLRDFAEKSFQEEDLERLGLLVDQVQSAADMAVQHGLDPEDAVATILQGEDAVMDASPAAAAANTREKGYESTRLRKIRHEALVTAQQKINQGDVGGANSATRASDLMEIMSMDRRSGMDAAYEAAEPGQDGTASPLVDMNRLGDPRDPARWGGAAGLSEEDIHELRTGKFNATDKSRLKTLDEAQGLSEKVSNNPDELSDFLANARSDAMGSLQLGRIADYQRIVEAAGKVIDTNRGSPAMNQASVVNPGVAGSMGTLLSMRKGVGGVAEEAFDAALARELRMSAPGRMRAPEGYSYGGRPDDGGSWLSGYPEAERHRRIAMEAGVIWDPNPDHFGGKVPEFVKERWSSRDPKDRPAWIQRAREIRDGEAYSEERMRGMADRGWDEFVGSSRFLEGLDDNFGDGSEEGRTSTERLEAVDNLRSLMERNTKRAAEISASSEQLWADAALAAADSGSASFRNVSPALDAMRSEWGLSLLKDEAKFSRMELQERDGGLAPGTVAKARMVAEMGRKAFMEDVKSGRVGATPQLLSEIAADANPTGTGEAGRDAIYSGMRKAMSERTSEIDKRLSEAVATDDAGMLTKAASELGISDSDFRSIADARMSGFWESDVLAQSLGQSFEAADAAAGEGTEIAATGSHPDEPPPNPSPEPPTMEGSAAEPPAPPGAGGADPHGAVAYGAAAPPVASGAAVPGAEEQPQPQEQTQEQPGQPAPAQQTAQSPMPANDPFAPGGSLLDRSRAARGSASGFSAEGMDGSPGFQLRSGQERAARISDSHAANPKPRGTVSVNPAYSSSPVASSGPSSDAPGTTSAQSMDAAEEAVRMGFGSSSLIGASKELSSTKDFGVVPASPQGGPQPMEFREPPGRGGGPGGDIVASTHGGGVRIGQAAVPGAGNLDGMGGRTTSQPFQEGQVRQFGDTTGIARNARALGGGPQGVQAPAGKKPFGGVGGGGLFSKRRNKSNKLGSVAKYHYGPEVLGSDPARDEMEGKLSSLRRKAERGGILAKINNWYGSPLIRMRGNMDAAAQDFRRGQSSAAWNSVGRSALAGGEHVLNTTAALGLGSVPVSLARGGVAAGTRIAAARAAAASAAKKGTTPALKKVPMRGGGTGVSNRRPGAPAEGPLPKPDFKGTDRSWEKAWSRSAESRPKAGPVGGGSSAPKPTSPVGPAGKAHAAAGAASLGGGIGIQAAQDSLAYTARGEKGGQERSFVTVDGSGSLFNSGMAKPPGRH